MSVATTRQFDALEAALGARELIEYCYAQGWTDGLPVVPPVQEIVDEFLAQTARDPDEVLALAVQRHLAHHPARGERVVAHRVPTRHRVVAVRALLPGSRRR